MVRKLNGALRVCLDPQALNAGLRRSTHPVPTIDELLPEIAEAKVFSKCDVRHGFWHIQLDPESAELTAFVTPFGRYIWKRMPFGIKPASEIFQKRLEQALEGLEGVKNIHDDIMVWGVGSTDDEDEACHDRRMVRLLERCEQRGIALNADDKKYVLKEPHLLYMGHIFTKDGLKVDPAKAEVIRQMPKPEDPAAVRRFLGMANYLARFVPNMSQLSAPLRVLIESET